jgi:hypothetical protein
MEITLTDNERRDFLRAHNELRSIMFTIQQCNDLWVSDLAKLERLQHLLHNTLKFSPPVDDEGERMWYSDFVLEEEVPSDD